MCITFLQVLIRRTQGVLSLFSAAEVSILCRSLTVQCSCCFCSLPFSHYSLQLKFLFSAILSLFCTAEVSIFCHSLTILCNWSFNSLYSMQLKCLLVFSYHFIDLQFLSTGVLWLFCAVALCRCSITENTDICIELITFFFLSGVSLCRCCITVLCSFSFSLRVFYHCSVQLQFLSEVVTWLFCVASDPRQGCSLIFLCSCSFWFCYGVDKFLCPVLPYKKFCFQSTGLFLSSGLWKTISAPHPNPQSLFIWVWNVVSVFKMPHVECSRVLYFVLVVWTFAVIPFLHILTDVYLWVTPTCTWHSIPLRNSTLGHRHGQPLDGHCPQCPCTCTGCCHIFTCIAVFYWHLIELQTVVTKSESWPLCIVPKFCVVCRGQACESSDIN